jgi:hypothetical protein
MRNILKETQEVKRIDVATNFKNTGIKHLCLMKYVTEFPLKFILEMTNFHNPHMCGVCESIILTLDYYNGVTVIAER